MKTLLQIITFILFETVAFGQASTQNAIKCIYKVTFQPDSTDQNTRLEEITYLFISNNNSQFVSKKFMERDSLKNAFKKTFDPSSGHLDLSQIHIPKSWFSFIINKTNDKVDVYYDKLGWYKYEEHPGNICWEIDNEVKKINGFNCQKASAYHGGRKYIAWFTQEIPYSNGPYIFMGLPGMVIKISDTDNDYQFTLTDIKKFDGRLPMQTPDNFTETTKKELIKFLTNYRKNPIVYLQQYASVNLSPEEVERIKNRERRKNNPIELKAD